MSMARCIGWCRASPPNCSARIDRLGGLNAPHLIFGKILAQAYDTAAYKIAADDLLLGHKVDILFHALGAGVVMDDETRINALMVETKAGRAGGARPTSSSIAPATAISRPGPARRSRVGDSAGSMLYPLDDVPPQRHRSGQGRRGLAHDPGADGKGRAARHASFPRKAAIVRPQKNRDRMAGQLHADDEAGRQRDRRHRTRRADALARSRAAARSMQSSNSCSAGAGLRKILHRRHCRRSSASARRGA